MRFTLWRGRKTHMRRTSAAANANDRLAQNQHGGISEKQ
jgi:hypothetical protein